MQSDEQRARRLRNLHLVATIFMLAHTIIIGVIPLKSRLPQTVGFPLRLEEGPIGIVSVRQVYSLNPTALICVFTGLAALDHFVVTIFAFLKPALWQNLLFVDKKMPFRWIEYSFSASIMSVLIAGIAGIYDIHTLFLIACLTGICNLSGLIIEMLPKDQVKAAKSVFWLASLAVIVSWLPILCYFFEDTDGIPGFVYAAFLLTAVMYVLFGANNYIASFTSIYDYARAEMIYVILSFTAKTFLAYDVWGGYKAAEEDM